MSNDITTNNQSYSYKYNNPINKSANDKKEEKTLVDTGLESVSDMLGGSGYDIGTEVATGKGKKDDESVVFWSQVGGVTGQWTTNIICGPAVMFKKLGFLKGNLAGIIPKYLATDYASGIGATVGATLGDTTAGHILYDGFKHTGEEFADYLHNSENAQAVLETGEKIKDTTIGTAKEAEKMVTNAHNTAVNATVQVAETAEKKYNELINAEVQGLEDLANSKVKDVVNVDTIVGTAKEAGKMIANGHNTAVNTTVKVAETAEKKYNALINAEADGIEATVETAKEVKDTVVGTVKEAGKMITNAHESAVNATADGIEATVETAKEVKDAAVAVATDNALTNFGDKLGSWLYKKLH